MHETPADCIINRLGSIRDFGDERGDVLETLISQRFDQFRRLVIRFKHDLEPVAQTLDIFRRLDRVKARLARRRVLHCIQIQRMKLFLAIGVSHFFVEANLGFIAKPLALEQSIHQFARLFSSEIFLPEFVVRDQGREIFAHVIPHVHTDQIYQPERCRFWPTH